MDNSSVSTGTTLEPAGQELLSQSVFDLEQRSPLDVLRWAADQYSPRLTFATGFGSEGCVLIDLIGRHHLPIDIFTLDTGLLFPETYELWRRLEKRYALTIRGVKPALSVDDQAVAHGDRLWAKAPERCCDMRKVAPLKTELQRVDAWVTAIRREQTLERENALVTEWDTKFDIVKVNPLVRWTRKDVWAYLLLHEVPYNPLHDQGYPSIGCGPCTSVVREGEDDRAGRWRGIAKTECGLHGPVIPLTPVSETT